MEEAIDEECKKRDAKAIDAKVVVCFCDVNGDESAECCGEEGAVFVVGEGVRDCVGDEDKAACKEVGDDFVDGKWWCDIREEGEEVCKEGRVACGGGA